MKVQLPKDCGNSPRSELTLKLAVLLVGNDFSELEPYLSDNFSWSTPGEHTLTVSKAQLEGLMSKGKSLHETIKDFTVHTAFSHGKYASVSSTAMSSNGMIFYSHDLYEYSSAGPSAKLVMVTSYIVDRKEQNPRRIK